MFDPRSDRFVITTLLPWHNPAARLSGRTGQRSRSGCHVDLLARHHRPGDAFSRRSYEPPEGPVETAIAAIWADVLKLDQVGRRDNFFELGGHSLLAIRVLERMRPIGIELKLTSFFERATVAETALAIEPVEAAEVGERIAALSEEISELSDDEVTALLGDLQAGACH